VISLETFLIIGALLFSCGLLAILTKRNAIGILMGVELILNAANINFVAFAFFRDPDLNGVLIALFVFVIAVAEAAVALAIILNVYRTMNTINVDEVSNLRK
jgi:NADH:ubiquinone oxidoreductase subunit K